MATPAGSLQDSCGPAIRPAWLHCQVITISGYIAFAPAASRTCHPNKLLAWRSRTTNLTPAFRKLFAPQESALPSV